MPSTKRDLKGRDTCSEVDFKTFMSLMVVLVPILLITAQFGKITVLDVKIPEKGGVNTDTKKDTPSDKDNRLLLTTIIADSIITIGSNNGFLPSITYREFHQYIAKDDHYTFSVEYNPEEEVLHPFTNRVMEQNEIQEMNLYATDNSNTIIKSYYNSANELMTDAAGNPATNISIGDTIFTLTTPRRLMVALNIDDFQKQPLSAYDALKCKLSAIKRRYPDVDDSDKITIAAENSVKYDKIIQIMDVVKEAQYPDISIAKLRQS